MIHVLVVDDSPVSRALIKRILESDPQIRVVGVASHGREAVDLVLSESPDVVTMDIHMPVMDVYQATREIMETQPLPIVIVSASWNPRDVERTFRAVEAGAVAFLEKPRGIGHPDFEEAAGRVLKTVKSMSKVKVVTASSTSSGEIPGSLDMEVRKLTAARCSIWTPLGFPVEPDEKMT